MADATTTDPILEALDAAMQLADRERDHYDAEYTRLTEDAARAAHASGLAQRRADACTDLLDRLRSGKLTLGGLVAEATVKSCPRHALYDHVDGRGPWCDTCRGTVDGRRVPFEEGDSRGWITSQGPVQTR